MRPNRARARAFTVGLLASAALSACGGGGGTSQAPVTNVVVSKSNLYFTGVGQTAKLAASVVGGSGASVTWTSTAPDQVAVDPTGVVSALQIGSAQIFAEAGGVRSLPTFVVVAEPAPGALLLTDDQVLAVGLPLGLDPGDIASVGTQYEVRVSGVAPAPSAGTPVLALGDAPVAGTVVSTRVDAGTLVLTLQLAPLYELLSRYHIDLEIDLGQYPSQDLAAYADSTAPPPTPNWPVWPPVASTAGVVSGTSLKDVVEPFHSFECDPTAKASLLKQEVSLTESGTISYVLKDFRDDPALPPGYVLRKVTGSLTADGKVGLALDAGFSTKLDCRVQKLVPIKCFGWFSLALTPAVRYGVGATLEGSLKVGQAELSVEGKLGGSFELGWECAPPLPCQSISNVTPIEDVKPKAVTPDLSSMRLKLSGMFYGLLGLDAALGLGKLGTAGIVEARLGPKQSIDLGFESDQATDQAYASTFDLKLSAVVEPGKGVQDALKKDIDDSGVSVKFSLQFDNPIAESPKGTFTVDKTTANFGDTVTLTVDLDPATVTYGPFGYQVMSIEIYRQADGETEFKPFKCGGPTSPLPTCTIAVSTSGDNQIHFQTLWKVTDADAGTNTLVAFVRTIFAGEVTDAHIPFEEIAVNTQQQIKVPCYSGGPPALRATSLVVRPPGTRAATCADQWNAALTYDSGPVGTPPLSLVHHTANLTFVRNPNAFDPTGLEPQWVATTGTLGVSVTDPDPACNMVVHPSAFTYPTGDPSEYSLLVIDYTQNPPAFSFAVQDLVKLTVTETCPTYTIDTPTSYLIQIGGAGTLVTPTDTSIVGHSTGPDGSNVTWNFSR
jgi:hypothetical protein